MSDKVLSRHLKHSKAIAAQSDHMLTSDKLSRKRGRTSGYSFRRFDIVRGFLHWKVVEI